MITKELLEKLERHYGKDMVRLVLFPDCSGHTEVRNSKKWWKYDFAFENISQLEDHLRPAPGSWKKARGILEIKSAPSE
jgi:hypothetical protein